ncbi:hypothetical protein [Deinococcus koreensis]|uniref:Uncharacterized protein n=1 Tax=Deinococcus koreensis TaxID=2054903 RepID=A0A2K3URU4_9DEIO|nr:hypothetical protein [Deinococcus koreensis]PNY79266.1 hypothetical protein CVO96_20355 [Deinococcus koreensis]
MSLLTLRGRWVGGAHRPGRSFQGVVEEPGSTGLRPGDPVTVRFEAGTDEGPQARAHGRYHLEGMPARTFVLVSFTCQDRDPSDRAVLEDSEQVWGGEVFTRA